MTLKFKKTHSVGYNNHGYEFGVGLIGNEWYGFAVGKINTNDRMIFLFPDCDSQDLMPPLDSDRNRDEVIRRTAAYAQFPENGYGGISEWTVGEHLRSKPEDYVCVACRQLFCQECEDDDGSVFIDQTEDGNYSLGNCCECEGAANVRNIWGINKKSPTPNRGWGCVVCVLPSDGAIAVLCDECHDRLSGTEQKPKFVCVGYPGENGRISFSELKDSHEHNFAHD